MKVQLLPSTINDDGSASTRQHLTTFVIDDTVAFDAGSLALSCNDIQRNHIRDIVLTHAHLDHIAGLPLFIDDLFSTLTDPVLVHATAEVIDILERDIFNWSVYPRFSELYNENGPVLKYKPFEIGREFLAAHLKVLGVKVNHKVPTNGFLISDGATTIALTGDTAGMDEFWMEINNRPQLHALLIECAFPDDLTELAEVSHHLTPKKLHSELTKFKRLGECPVYVINLKPMHRENIIGQIEALDIENLQILKVGRIYEW